MTPELAADVAEIRRHYPSSALDRISAALEAAASVQRVSEAERAVVEAAVASIETSARASSLLEREGYSVAWRAADAEVYPRAREVARLANELLALRKATNGSRVS